MQQTEEIEEGVVAIFADLSRLIGVEETNIRKAAAAVLAKANIGQVLEHNQAQRDAAEQRALEAERRVAKLESEVEVLQKQNEALERQLGLL
jgi:alkylated DNA nucleotide flippase Atl1